MAEQEHARVRMSQMKDSCSMVVPCGAGFERLKPGHAVEWGGVIGLVRRVDTPPESQVVPADGQSQFLNLKPREFRIEFRVNDASVLTCLMGAMRSDDPPDVFVSPSLSRNECALVFGRRPAETTKPTSTPPGESFRPGVVQFITPASTMIIYTDATVPEGCPVYAVPKPGAQVKQIGETGTAAVLDVADGEPGGPQFKVVVVVSSDGVEHLLQSPPISQWRARVLHGPDCRLIRLEPFESKIPTYAGSSARVMPTPGKIKLGLYDPYGHVWSSDDAEPGTVRVYDAAEADTPRRSYNVVNLNPDHSFGEMSAGFAYCLSRYLKLSDNLRSMAADLSATATDGTVPVPERAEALRRLTDLLESGKAG